MSLVQWQYWLTRDDNVQVQYFTVVFPYTPSILQRSPLALALQKHSFNSVTMVTTVANKDPLIELTCTSLNNNKEDQNYTLFSHSPSYHNIHNT
jgi:hypothetical protein